MRYASLVAPTTTSPAARLPSSSKLKSKFAQSVISSLLSPRNDSRLPILSISSRNRIVSPSVSAVREAL